MIKVFTQSLSAYIIFFTVPCMSALCQESIPKGIELLDSEGRKILSQEALQNDGPIIIDFWASYCKPCIIKYNTIAPLYQQWIEEFGVKVYIVSIDDITRINLAKKLIEKFDWPFESLFDPHESLIDAMNVDNGVPLTFIYNKEGYLILKKSGVMLIPNDRSDVGAAIKELYAGSRSMTDFSADLSEYIDALKAR